METERGKFVGKAIARAMAEVLSASSRDVIARMNDCREGLLSGLEDDEERIEIQRRIAEAKISILWEIKDSPQFMIEWEEMERLGYSSAEREASMLFYYLKYCARGGHDLAYCAEPLARLERLSAAMPEGPRSHFNSVQQKIREQLLANAGT